MKLYITALALFGALASAATIPAVERTIDVPQICTPEKLTELAGCKCLVLSQNGTIGDDLKALCTRSFGDESGWDGACDAYTEDGEIDVEAVHKDVANVNEVCGPLFLNELGHGNGIGRQIEATEVQLETTNRSSTLLLIALILLL